MITATVVVGLALLSPAVSEAATFEVNVTNDDDDAMIDGRCDTDVSMAGRQCSLRGALAEANNRPNADRVEFDPAVFDGTLADEINPSDFLPVTEEVAIDAGDCGADPFHEPCAGIDPAGIRAMVVTGDDVSIRGLAIYGAGITGVAVEAVGADRLRVRNTWFGRRLNGTASANALGISLEVRGGTDDSDEAVIGGRRARDQNVFGGGGNAIFISGGDRNRILGNLFGVDAFGAALSPIGVPIGIGADFAIEEPAVGNVVGARLSAAAAASAECDGGCNAITNSVFSGISIAAPRTTIAGNFIGLRPDGASALENGKGISVASLGDGTTIGGGRRERNYITGGELAFDLDTAQDLTVEGNLIGFDSTGQTPSDPPEGASGNGYASFVRSNAEGPTRVIDNRYALAGSTTGLAVGGKRAVVSGNTFGLRLGGGDLSPVANARAIRVLGRNAVIGKPGAGNVIANLSWLNQSMIAISGVDPGKGDRNRIQGNLIGVDSQGDPHPITGDGIGLSGEANGNRIGGITRAAENVISNVSGDPISVLDAGESPSGNEFLRNRGSNNGAGLFVELAGATGFGNGDPSLHGGIEAPTIDEAGRTRIEGSGAEGGAEIWIFRTRDAPGASPRNVKTFVARTTANGSGNWSARFDRIPAADNLTALQTDAGDGSSELALVVAP